MDFLKNLLSVLFPRRNNVHPQKPVRRSPQIESLESRELLSVNLLGPITAYAQQDNPAEIRFELTTTGTSASKLDFTVQQTAGSSLDPSAISLINHSTGQLVALSNIVNGTKSSSASAQLAAGSYSIYVYADAERGNFLFSITQEEGKTAKTGLDILVSAAIVQQLQPISWANQVKHYNSLLANTEYAGAASTLPIVKYYPEVDVNGDGKVDTADLTLAQQLVTGTSANATVKSYYVVAQDLEAPIMTIGLKNNTDPTIIGKITDASGIKSASYKIDNGSWVALSVDANGNYTILNTALGYGNHTITVFASDNKGNSAILSDFAFTYLSPAPPQNISDSGTGKITIPSNLQVQSVAGEKLNEPGKSIVLPNDQGAITLGNGGLLTYKSSNSFYVKLAKGETATITVPVVMKDTHGNEYTSIAYFTLTGVDDPSVLVAKKTTIDLISNDLNNPVKTIDAGFSVTDPDTKDANGPFVYSYSKVKDGSLSAANGLIVDFDTTTGTFKIDTAKLKNRNVNSTVTLDVSVKSVSGGVVSKTLTISLKPVAIPTAPTLMINATETTGNLGKVAPTVAGNGFTTTNLIIITETGFNSLPSGISLESVASIDTNGNFVFTPNKKFEYLKQNETLKLKLQYTITDTQYRLTGLGIIELTIVGKSTPPTGPGSQIIGTNGEFNSTETNGTAPKISVPKDKILADWTLPDGQNAYSILPGNISFENWSGGSTNPLNTNSFGSVNVDSFGNLVFTPTSTIYNVLGAGQWIDIAVTIAVRDASGTTVPGGKVVFRINGANDAPIIGYRQDNGFSFASNSKTPISIDPGFTKSDPDLNDTTESLVFNIDETSSNLGFNIGSSDGKISITNDKMKSLNGNYTITVMLNDGRGGTTKKNINVHFYQEAAPILSNVIVPINEKELNVSKDLNDAITNKPEHYSFSASPVPTQISFDNGQTWTDPATSGVNLTGCWNFNAQTGLFEFLNPTGHRFDDLTDGQTLSIKFEYKVSNNDYENCETIGSLVVKISGVNDLPVHNLSQPTDFGTVTESTFDATKKIENLLTEWNDADHPNDLKISGIQIINNGDSPWISLDELQKSSNLFKISDNGRSVELNLSHEIFRNLPEDEVLVLTVKYTVRDPQNGTGTGLFTINILGKHTPIKLVSKTDITQPININELPPNGQIAKIQFEYDTNDQIVRSITCDSGDNLFIFDESGNIRLDPALRDSLDMNKTYTVTVEITNPSFNDSPIQVVYVLNFIRRSAPTLADTSQTLSLLENESKTLDLQNDTGNSYKNLSDYSYEITFVSGSTQVNLVKGVDYKIENGVFSFITGNKFDYLQEETNETLTFSYKITDTAQGDGTNFVEGTIAVVINGANNAPIINGEETFNITNSGLDDDATIAIGHFDIADIDDGDTLILSAQTLSGTAGGEVLETLPIFRIDENGNVTMENTDLPNLASGESATYQVEVKAVDSQGGTVTKTITVIVHAKAKPILNVDQTDWNATESDQPISKSYDISVQDVAETFIVQRTGNNWYTKPTVVVTIPEAYQGIEGLTDLFKIDGDSIDGYRLTFDAESKFFDFLRKNEELIFTVTITIKDSEYLVETTSNLTFTVTGVGDQHTVDMKTNSFNYWTNIKDSDQTTFDPIYTITDPDWEEKYTYTLNQINIDTLPTGLDLNTLQALIQLDEKTGNFVLNKTELDALGISENFSYKLVVRITSDSDEFYSDAEIDLNIKIAEKPIVSSIDKQIDEMQQISEAISITKPNDGAIRDSNWYTIENLQYVSYDGEIPDLFNIEEQALAAASIQDGLFKFNPGENLNFLPEGAVLTLRYQFTVYDTKFDTSTTQTITVTINGKNTQPDWKEGTNLETAKVDDGYIDIIISDLVKDIDLGDSHTLWSIDGKNVIPGQPFEIDGKGEFLYENGILRYYATGAELIKLRQNEVKDLDFVFVVKDNSGIETTNLSNPKTFTINVAGTNKAPVIVEEELVYIIRQGDQPLTINVNQIATDTNVGDTLKFSQILSNIITPDIELEYNKVSLTFNDTSDTITIDPAAFNWQMYTGSSWMFSVVVTDDFNATSQGKLITITFMSTIVSTGPESILTLNAASIPVTLLSQQSVIPIESPVIADINNWTAEDELLLRQQEQEEQEFIGGFFDPFEDDELSINGKLETTIYDDALFALDPEIETILAVYQLSI